MLLYYVFFVWYATNINVYVNVCLFKLNIQFGYRFASCYCLFLSVWPCAHMIVLSFIIRKKIKISFIWCRAQQYLIAIISTSEVSLVIPITESIHISYVSIIIVITVWLTKIDDNINIIIIFKYWANKIYKCVCVYVFQILIIPHVICLHNQFYFASKPEGAISIVTQHFITSFNSIVNIDVATTRTETIQAFNSMS